MSAAAANLNKYRLTRAVVFPAGTRIVFVSHMKQEVYRLAQALMHPSEDLAYELFMPFDDALKAGLIEKVE